ncbi:hypothetical protein POX_e06540 [Penicillium oxalicum]|uniref:Uncharacterized protein n=1 Tax=Penicillium oxalicum (strain 114-2 / CGMCC 5302) TaxID=933388 RepID=S7ZAE6_PENO1|nr:hypothetical protein POX_e06540 [Penicillium oxalicum]EPS27575.1 hypothetical protein PDE_02518 [Penicillium oxalicum 114-2]KAI2788523.1 hypothetical protein POX_e06540 [Penicillium oxalicum]
MSKAMREETTGHPQVLIRQHRTEKELVPIAAR